MIKDLDMCVRRDLGIVIIFPDIECIHLELAVSFMYTGKAVAEDSVGVYKIKELLKSLNVKYEESNSCQTVSEIAELSSLGLWKEKVDKETVSAATDEVIENEPDFKITPCYDDDDEDSDNEGRDVEDSSSEHHLKGSGAGFEDISSAEEVYCSKYCNRKCGVVFDAFKEGDKFRIQTMFSSEKYLDAKRKLLAHLISQHDCGLNMDSYWINNHSFCLPFLCKETGISVFLLKSVLSDFWSGIRIYSHGNAGVVKIKASTSMFIAWVKQFCDSYGQSAPDEDVTVLSHWLSKKVLYDMYLEETVGPHLAQSTFYEHFKSYFGPNRVDRSLPQVRISKYSSHSVCNICTALNSNKRQSRSESELKIAQEKINNHRIVFGGARRKVDEIIQSAQSFPSDNLGIIYNL